MCRCVAIEKAVRSLVVLYLVEALPQTSLLAFVLSGRCCLICEFWVKGCTFPCGCVAMEEAVRSLVVLYLVEAFPQATLFAFCLVGKIANAAISLEMAQKTRSDLRARLANGKWYHLNLSCFTLPIAPALAFDPWLLEDPISHFAHFWRIDTTSPGDIETYKKGLDPFDRKEKWKLIDLRSPTWKSAHYLQKHVLSIGLWRGVRARPLEPRRKQRFPSQAPEIGERGHFCIAYIRDGSLGAALCFWQRDSDGTTSDTSDSSQVSEWIDPFG